MTDAHIPVGRHNNPSSWSKRVWLILLALAGCAVAAYLALYQTGIVAHVWEPFFGDGSRVILDSSLSRLLPVPDAALGAFGYLMEAGSGAIGGRSRWSAMPWIVLLYGGIVGLFAVASIALIVLQSAYFHAWCALCLTSAAVSSMIAVLAFDEPRASWRFIKHEKVQGRSVWRAFWGYKQGLAQVQPAADAINE